MSLGLHAMCLPTLNRNCKVQVTVRALVWLLLQLGGCFPGESLLCATDVGGASKRPLEECAKVAVYLQENYTEEPIPEAEEVPEAEEPVKADAGDDE